LLVLVPGVVTNVNDTVTGTATTSFPIHGGRTNEGRLFLDGLIIGSPPNGNSATSYVVDAGNALEVTFMTAGALLRASTRERTKRNRPLAPEASSHAGPHRSASSSLINIAPGPILG
jgi:hypothetical protein